MSEESGSEKRQTPAERLRETLSNPAALRLMASWLQGHITRAKEELAEFERKGAARLDAIEMGDRTTDWSRLKDAVTKMRAETVADLLARIESLENEVETLNDALLASGRMPTPGITRPGGEVPFLPYSGSAVFAPGMVGEPVFAPGLVAEAVADVKLQEERAEHTALLNHYRAVLHDLSRPQPPHPAVVAAEKRAELGAMIAEQQSGGAPLGA